MEAAEVAAVVGKVAERLLVDAVDDDGGTNSHEAGITEESVAEVMRWLELEIKLAAGTALAPQPAPTRFVMASGNDESCGPALSGPASMVMATVDGPAGAPVPPPVPWPWLGPAPDKEPEEDDDDEWVLQLLTDGPEEEMLCGSQ